MKTYGYLRVSTAEQNLEKNKADILALANQLDLGRVEFLEEKVSGTVSWHKRKLADLIASTEAGDVIIVSELSRLGRSMLECMEILSITVQKEVRIYAIKGNWHLDGSLQSKVLAMAFAMASEIERDLMSQRTREGLQDAAARGVRLGRPRGPGRSKLDLHREEIVALLGSGSTKRFIAKRYKTSRTNLDRWLMQRRLARG